MPPTTAVRPPTNVRGHVSDADFAALLDELTVDLPADLMWPTSVITFASMRREARLASILAGYGLQLRRAQWQVDGAGCRPEVVQLVADGLGLQVAGRDVASAARTRGVSWHEHLRAALASLIYGHSGFELHAEPAGAGFGLAGLYERPPWTIGDIHVDPKSGAFLGVSQDAPRADGVPEIGADRMAWYCREREGANWAGVSLLRASFPAWVFKREMLKVHATANRRFGMGVPVMEALPGTQPSAGQMREAMEFSSAARVGDQSGAASPPGFAFKLVGLTGAVPDTLAFIKFLNQEMARSALMQHLDLGSTESGSRALGSAFIDSWMLALETEAEQVADVATRQVAAQVVRWNRGADEPVPRVVVSGIGSRREVTAESLKALLDSGGLSADPGLEAWIRREYRLPERAGMPQPAPTTDRVAASAARSGRPKGPRRREAAGQFALPVMAQGPAREPTEFEDQSGADFAAIAEELEQAQQELAEQWPGLSEAMVAALVAAVVAAVAAGTLEELGSLVVPDEALAGVVEALGSAMVGLAGTSADRAAGELRGQGADVEVGTVDEGRLNDAADAFAGVIASGYATGAGRAALQHAGPDADAEQVGEAVREHLDSLSTPADTPGGWVATNLGGALHQAYAAGRRATFENADGAVAGVRWLISAIQDRNLCKPCDDDDQRIFDTLAEVFEVMPVAGNAACLGGLRCRCTLVALAQGT